MSQSTKQALIVKKQIISVPMKFSTGSVMGRFLVELRDNKRIMANRCPKCKRFQLPPREVCAICCAPATIWEPVGPGGFIQSFDIVFYASPDPLTGEMRETPYTTVNVQLDGCDGTATLWHELDETDPAKVVAGRRVVAIFNEERTGSVHDIKHFKLLDEMQADFNKVTLAEAKNMPAVEIPLDKFEYVVDGKLALPYQYYAGAVGSKFLVGLRDEQKIRAVHCKKCNKTMLPPRKTCHVCFTNLSENWVDVSNQGVVTAFTTVRYEETYQPVKPPYHIALIKLDGCDNAVTHIVDANGGELKIGQRVEAVFADNRIGDILDISHFKTL